MCHVTFYDDDDDEEISIVLVYHRQYIQKNNEELNKPEVNLFLIPKLTHRQGREREIATCHKIINFV